MTVVRGSASGMREGNVLPKSGSVCGRRRPVEAIAVNDEHAGDDAWSRSLPRQDQVIASSSRTPSVVPGDYIRVSHYQSCIPFDTSAGRGESSTLPCTNRLGLLTMFKPMTHGIHAGWSRYTAESYKARVAELYLLY